MATPKWRKLIDHVQSIKEGVYEKNVNGDYDNRTRFGEQYGMNGEPWCVMFDWDMYADTGLEEFVPKIASVNGFTSWAKEREQWSEYPSVGAWVNLHDGGHTELVVGFDETYVYTKGGNTVEAGATDANQGKGVYSHKTERKSASIVGYFAPKFPNDECPPTADPHDHRGGAARKEWRWHGHRLPHEDHKVKASEVVFGARNVSIRIVQAALKAEVGLDYSSAPGTFGPRTKAAVAEFQRELGFTGADADGVFGRHSLVELGKRHKFRVYGLDFFDRKRDDDDGKPGSGREGIPLDAVTYKHVPDGSASRAAKEACHILKVPEDHWVKGIMTAAKRESTYRFNAVNTYDSNAHGPEQSDGHPQSCTRGLMQVMPETFAENHQPGTSNNIYDGVANICAAMNYVMVRYGVYRDGSNLAGRVQQFDPKRPPMGY
ncbi:peptidoglycan-binding protein [Streptomyces piniterrae]|nr:peptidoglycan-binding protein [Streptomyces piniterrae]